VVLAVRLAVRRNEASPVGSGKHLVTFNTSEAGRMPNLSLHLHLFGLIATFAATSAFVFTATAAEFRRSAGCWGRRGLGSPGSSRAGKSSRAALPRDQFVLMVVAVRLVIRRYKASPVGTGKLPVTFDAFQALNVPDLALHHQLLGHIDGFPASGTFVLRASSIARRRRRGCRRGAGVSATAFLLLFPFRFLLGKGTS